jgi:hypothetical protein
MACTDCLDDIQDLLGSCNSIPQLKTYIREALDRLCGTRCGGQLTTIGLDPEANPAAATSEAFPSLPTCECALMVLQDTSGNLYFSADTGTSWTKLSNTLNNVATSSPTVNDDSGDGYSIGSRWINTSTDEEWVCTDATVGAAVWVSTTFPPTASFVELVPPTVLGAPAATIDITGIPATYEDLILVVRARSTGAGSDVLMTFNNDTGTNYAVNRERQTSTTATYEHVVNQNNILISHGIVSSTGTAGYFAHMKAEIFSYARATMSRNGQVTASRFENATTLHRSQSVFAWEDLASAINRITLTPSAGNFAAGTVYALYGVSP